jgi:hypothetical protein
MVKQNASDVIVVVPAYRETMLNWEHFALINNLKQLSNYAFALVVPESLDCHEYLSLAPSINVCRFPDLCFATVEGYSLLCLSKLFYQTFQQFEYMLICQLDAFVFEDQMQDWLSKKYSYIGGAVAKSDEASGQIIRWITSQNGGFSLRNIHSHLQVLHSQKKINCKAIDFEIYKDMTGTTLAVDSSASHRLKILLQSSIAQVQHGFARMSSQEYIDAGQQSCIAEDQFWSRFAPFFDAGFKIAPLQEAQRFCMQFGLEQTVPMLGSQMPFGCHGREIVTTMYKLIVEKRVPENDYEYLVQKLVLRLADC